MENVIIELNQSHLKDLKTFFDETQNLKRVLDTTLDKISEMSSQVGNNTKRVEEQGRQSGMMKREMAKLSSGIDQVDKELEKYYIWWSNW
jgi:peptidoglycan hydrolase CwlO-like protein